MTPTPLSSSPPRGLAALIVLALLPLATAGLVACADELAELVPATVDDDPSLPALDLDDTRLHLATHGRPGDPVVIVLHGGPGGDHRALEPMAALADSGLFVVLWDQRGTGLSRRHACDDLTADRYLADLEALVDRFAPAGTPVFFVGHSWGAMYATWYMNEHPERASGAVLMEPGGLTAAEVEAYMSALVSDELLSEGMGDALWTGRLVTPDDHARADLMTAVMFDSVGAALGFSRTDPAPSWRSGGVVSTCLPASAGDYDWTTRLAEVEAPILYLHGDKNRASPPARQRRIAAHYHDAEVRLIEGAGHDLHWSHRAVIVPMARDFILETLAADGGAR
ncbi:MAG: alpha/beta hydrolase [Deltaproteobacteria bacterium]|nr:alpha/beta hydrolase [Deltaproteobacteria bacterium]